MGSGMTRLIDPRAKTVRLIETRAGSVLVSVDDVGDVGLQLNGNDDFRLKVTLDPIEAEAVANAIFDLIPGEPS